MKTFLPALRAKMGDRIYYISFMKMGDIANRVKFAEDIHKSDTLNRLLQRRLSDRSIDIAKYLENQEQRFFNTIIIGVYGGAPQWLELAVSKNARLDPNNLPEEIDGTVGFLSLSGQEKLFAIDGQHRVAGIHLAIKDKPTLKDEEVSVIFLSAKKDDESMKRTRRLFSTLNRYAKAVSKRDIIALDEDDVVAIIIRQMLDDYKLFSGKRINTAVLGKGIPTNDKDSITTLVTIYDALNIFLMDKSDKDWKRFLNVRPGEEVVEDYSKRATEYFDALQKYFHDLKLVGKEKKDISELRHSDGGHLLFRPIGLIIITNAVKFALKGGYPLDNILKRLSKLPLELSSEPWKGLLWEAIKKRMITRKENQEVATKLLYYMIGYDLSNINLTKEELIEAYASAINWDEEKSGKLELPHKLKTITVKVKRKDNS